MQVNDRSRPFLPIDIGGILCELVQIINGGTHMSKMKPISALRSLYKERENGMSEWIALNCDALHFVGRCTIQGRRARELQNSA
jgi:hypothetical protein